MASMVSSAESCCPVGHVSKENLELKSAELRRKNAALLEQRALLEEMSLANASARLAQENVRLANENALLTMSCTKLAISPYAGMLQMPPMPTCALPVLPPFGRFPGIPRGIPLSDPASLNSSVRGYQRRPLFSSMSNGSSGAASWRSRRSSTSSMSSKSSIASTLSNSNLDRVAESLHVGPKTTVVLRNIPDGFSREKLLDLVDAAGFQTFYDVVSLPMDLKTEAALGYAFINFTTPEHAETFKEQFNGSKDWSDSCDNVCEVLWCDNLQGYEAHVERYRNSPLMHESVADKFKPALYKNGIRVPFPEPTKTIKKVRPRTRNRGCQILTEANNKEGEHVGGNEEKAL